MKSHKFLKINIPKVGFLEYDKILSFTSYPYLFVCKNEKNELFLCFTYKCDNIEKKWLLIKTNPETIIRILKNEISLRTVFLKAKDIRLTIIKDTQKISIIESTEKDWNDKKSKLLPETNESILADNEEILNEILYYEEMLRH